MGFFATWHNGGFASTEGWGDIAGGKRFAFWFWSAGQQAPLAWAASSLLSLLAPAECSCLISSSFCGVGSQQLPLGWFYSEGHFSANSFHGHVRAHISSKFCQRGTTANALPFSRSGLCTVLQGLYLSPERGEGILHGVPSQF